jgi:hypothetical protein
MIAAALRWCAVAIAAAALIDPSVTVAARPRQRVALVTLSPAAPAVVDVAQRLTADLRGGLDVAGGLDPSAAAAIVVGDRYPAALFPPSLRVFTVTVDASAHGPRITAARAVRAVPGGTRIRVDVDLERLDDAPAGSIVTVVMPGVDRRAVEVGRVTHSWSARERHVSIATDALPIDSPPWHLQVRLLDASDTARDSSDLLVEDAAPRRVLFYEPRPSWIATFVRRALEADRTFVVSGLDYPVPGVRIASGGAASLAFDALRNVDVLVVGGLDRLTVSDRDTIDRFMRERGGSVVLLPDAKIAAGAAREWLSHVDVREMLLERAAVLAAAPPLPPIRASEMLVARATMPGAIVLASGKASGDAVILLMPRGIGRMVLSGALDAWRYRSDDDGAFDRFWRSTIAGVGLETPPPVRVQMFPAVARPGQTVRVTAQVNRSAAGMQSESPLKMIARVDDSDPVRLWPDAAVDAYSGSFSAPDAGIHHVTVSAAGAGAADAVGSAFVRVDPDARQAEPVLPSLAMLAASHRGIDVSPERLADLEDAVRRLEAPPSVREPRHPMRSALWIAPFAGCLCAEWWVRRRRGQR